MKWPRFYAIVDQTIAARHGWTVPGLGRAYLQAGARLLQVRAPHASSQDLLSWCDTLVPEGHGVGARVIVNDRVDVAKLSGADGVHLGQHDLTVTDAREQLGEQALVGLSTHTRSQIDRALTERIDYVAVGPVYATRTKRTGYHAVGLELVTYAASRSAVPIVAIGGIALELASTVVAAGAASVAVISDVFAEGDPEHRVRRYVRSLEK